MTKGKTYPLDYVIYNEGYSLAGEVEVNFYIGGVALPETDTVLVDTEVEGAPTKIVQIEILVPTDAATSTTVKVELIFAEDQNMTNNEVTVDVILNEAPLMTIDNLAMDDVVEGKELIEGSYSDDVEVIIAEIRVNGGSWIEVAWDSGDWSYNWDTTGKSNGMHSIEVMATDNLGITSDIVLINLSLENLPEITIAEFEDELNEEQILHFINGANQGDSVDISGSTTINAYSETNINTVHLTIITHIDGSLEGDIIVDDVPATQVGGNWENWKYTWTGINSLADGMYDIIATVSDAQDYNGTETYTVLLMADNELSDPTIATEIATDVEYELTETSNLINGTATDDYEVTEVVYRLGDDEEDPWVVATGTTEWEFSVAKSILEAGETITVYIKAFDGQEYSNVLAINLMRGEPEVDLSVTSVVFLTGQVKVAEEAMVTVTIKMTGATAIDNVDIRFSIGSITVLDNTTSITSSTFTRTFTFVPTAVHQDLTGFTVVIDPAEKLDDTNRANNAWPATQLPGNGKVNGPDGDGPDSDDDEAFIPGFEIALIAFSVCLVAVALRRREH